MVNSAARAAQRESCTDAAMPQDQVRASTEEEWAKLPASVKGVYTKIAAGKWRPADQHLLLGDSCL